ncbi:MAG: hypothetical protein CME06_06025 [Gemmatimonadetes bacterium]|nr:hypothetical protein [Gemmatimonadota bacterium]
MKRVRLCAGSGFVAIAFLGVFCLAGCGKEEVAGDACETGLWQVVQTLTPCLQATQTVVDDCRELDDPVSAVEEFATPEGLPEECAPQANNGELLVDCRVEADLDSLVAALDGDLVEEYLGETDLSGCTAIFSMSGDGEYSEQSFDYRLETWLRCKAGCSPETLEICLALQLVVGSQFCPTIHELEGVMY